MATLEAVKSKYIPRDNAFYRKYYHFFIISLMVLTLLLMVAIGVTIYQVLTRPLPLFYAQQPDKEKMSLVPYPLPNLLPDTILRFASKAATTAYTFDYANFNSQLRSARPYFTEAGWQVFLGSVERLINNILQNQLFVNGVVVGAPVITNQGPLPARGQVWRVEIPFLVTYQSANSTLKRNFYVVLSLVAVPTTMNPQGIGIDQFIMVQA